MKSTIRILGLGWWLQLKMQSRDGFSGFLNVLYPMFFGTVIFLMFRQTGDQSALITAAVGASVMGVWSAVSTLSAGSLQSERRQGTLELLVAAPRPFSLIVVPMTMAMATIGLYSLVATLVWGRLAFGIPISIDQPLVFIVAAVATAVGISLMGFLLAVSAVRYRGAWALGTALEMPIWLVCGFLIPIATLPSWVEPISWLLPPTWGVAAVHDAAFGGTPWRNIGICLAVSAVYGVLAALLARRLVDSARAHATLALT